MERLHKEPDVGRQDYNAFVNELKLFHQNRGTPFRHLPRINGREIDLYKLYNEVTALGGLQKVNDQQKWDVVGKALKLPRACANFCLAVRQIYIRYLSHYEKIHFMGEEPECDRSQSSESHTRKLQMTLLHPVPMLYNHVQHEVADSQRASSGLSQNFVTRTDYDKLCLSFLSGLPNEQELALNVSTILANEGHYMLHLEQAPKLVNFLVAQAGVWPSGDVGLRDLCLECWDGVCGRNMRRFWRSTLNLPNPKLAELCNWNIGDPDEDEKLLNLEADMGALNLEGQRVLRVALILHNLSFEKNNVPVLVSNPTFLKFVLLCMHSKWADLKQTAYDTLANLASEIQLSVEKDITLRLMFQTVMDGIRSSDRYLLIRSLDILSQWCLCGPNEDIVPSRLDVEIYQQMVSFLTVHDIMLLFFTLEALYALSDLGRYACEKIVSVHRAIGCLVSLLTLEPSQYGVLAQMRMKLVETLVPADAEECSESACVSTAPSPPSTTTVSSTTVTAVTTTTITTTTTAATTVTTVSPVVSTDDSETFVCNWLKATYEYAAGSSISRNELYADYVSHCSKLGKRGVVNANVFASCVKGVFSQCGLKKIESENGIISFHHDGLQKKKQPAAQAGSLVKAVNGYPAPPKKVSVSSSIMLSGVNKLSQKTSHSPILKAQLSAPPRPGISSPTVKRTVQTPAVVRKTVPLTTPCYVPSNKSPVVQSSSPNAGSSTLIKSLLANKVQQRNMQRQLHVQPNLRKMVIYTPEKGGCVNRNISATQTVMRAIRPGVSVSQQCIAAQFTRAPVQGSIIASKGRVVTTAPPRVLKTGPLLVPKFPTKSVKTATANIPPVSRLNGLIHDTQLEVCVQGEDVKSHEKPNSCQAVHIKAAQNHVTPEKATVDGSDSTSSVAESFKESSFSSDSERNSVLSLDDASQFSSQASTLNDSASDSSAVGQSISVPLSECSGIEDDKAIASPVNNSISTPPSTPQSGVHSNSASSPSSLLKSVLSELDCKSEDAPVMQTDKERICKRAPLLNGLLDKGKAPLSKEPQSFTLVQNGSKTNNSLMEVNLEKGGSASTLNSSVVSSSFTANGDSLMQLCTGQTTLSGTIEVQPDQKGVVRLHIESPENSNQGSDLSSISDIARTLECASKAISRTNAECSSHVPFSCTCETTATVTVITTNTSTLARPGQQIIVVTPALNQPQLHIQSPNIKFRILHSIPKVEETVDLIGFPRVSLNQLNQVRHTTVDTAVSTAVAKRPSSDPLNSVGSPEVKKARVDTKTPLLEATLRLPTPVPSTVPTNTISAKPFQDNQSSVPKSTTQMENMNPTKLSTVKAVAVPVQSVDFPSDKETKTFSGLLSAGDHSSSLPAASTSSKSLSSIPKLEYICEWKDCGKKFTSPGAVLVHAGKVHAPYSSDDMVCQWEGCDSMKRRRFSLLTHLQDWHCNERVLHAQAMRRKQLNQQGKTNIAAPQMPPPHPGYAPDAAILAIRRHALQYLNPKELSEEKESALTKSIRLTSALILRNLVTHSSLARSYLRCYEPELAYLAMSPVESSRTIAQCLSELSRPHE